MIEIVRLFKFDAGHRVYGHESKCKFPHGHEYRLEITFQSTQGLDDLGRVIDFGEIKKLVEHLIEVNWDHGFLVWHEDTQLLNSLRSLTDNKIYICKRNPTAENIGLEILEKVNQLFVYHSKFQHIFASKVTIWETSKCAAIVTLDQ